MKMKLLIMLLSSLLIVFLSFCSSQESVLHLDDKSFRTLFIQKVESDTTKEELTKTVESDSKINRVLELVEGLVVKESKKELMKMLKSQDSYMLIFSENQRLETGQVPFAFYILEDGTFVFTFEEINEVREKPLITTEKHPELLKDLKRDLEVEF